MIFEYTNKKHEGKVYLESIVGTERKSFKECLHWAVDNIDDCNEVRLMAIDHTNLNEEFTYPTNGS